MPIGVIGVGAMGLAVVGNLRRQGFAVAARDIVAERGRLAAQLGASLCDSPAQLSRLCDLVILLVVDDTQIEDVVFGQAGLIPGWTPGSTLLVSSTLAPVYVVDLSLRLSGHRIHVIDAPISGGPARAADGSMSMMLAGDPAVRQRHADVLAALSTRHFDLGCTVGDAARAKLVNNLIAAINLSAAAEGLALAGRLGLDQSRMLDLIMASSGASWIAGDRMPRALKDDYAPRAALPILTKDIGLALQMAAQAGYPTPLGSAAHALYQAALAQGYGEQDDAVLYEFYRSWSQDNGMAG